MRRSVEGVVNAARHREKLAGTDFHDGGDLPAPGNQPQRPAGESRRLKYRGKIEDVPLVERNAVAPFRPPVAGVVGRAATRPDVLLK